MKRLIRLILMMLIFIAWASSFICCVVALRPAQLVNRPDGLCESLILPQRNYDCQEYVVETGDGFLLGVQRMSSKRVAGAKKGAVFLMHALLTGGDIWVLNDPSEALGFILADAGYDVWIGNIRTTRFSSGHIVYKRTDKAFWDWSVDELADQDLPAMLGLVYSTTGTRLHYVGYSQGSQQAFAAFSQGLLVDYVDKVVMLGPVAYVDHGTSPLELGLFNLYLDKILEAANVHAFSTATPMGKQVIAIICGPTSFRCYNRGIFLLGGENCCLNLTRRPIFDKYELQTTSVKNLAHLAQQGRKSNFAKFDYGFWGNLKKYYSPWPPEYKLANIPTQNLLLMNGMKDQLADPTDVDRLVGELKGDVRVYTNPNYGHLDYVLGGNANSQVYNVLLDFLES